MTGRFDFESLWIASCIAVMLESLLFIQLPARVIGAG
jgi:hypothetical protein